MKKKRILSMLLAAALTVSCLPFVAYADEPMQVPEIRGENLLEGALWEQASGDAITEIAAEENTYVHISGLEPYVTAAQYSSGTVNTGDRIMPAGSYKISMMLRSVPATFEEKDTTLAAAHMDMGVSFGVSYKSGATASFEISNWGQIKASSAGKANGAFYWPDPIDTSDPDTKIDIFARNDSHFKYNHTSSILLTPEWREYVMFVNTTAEAKKFVISFRSASGNDNIVPFDVGDISVVRVASFDDSAVDGIATSYVAIDDAPELTGAADSEWIAQNNSSVATDCKEPASYYHADIPTSGTDTVISADSSATLTPGKYALSGNFRLSEFDFDGDNCATLEVTAKNSETDIVSFNVDLTNGWTENYLEFELDEEVTLENVELRVSGELVAFDFADISLTEIIPPPDEELTVESIGDDGEYNSVYNLKPGSLVALYKSGAVSMPAGSYKLTMKMRSAPASFGGANEALAAGNMDLTVNFLPTYKQGGTKDFIISNWGQLKASSDGYANGAFYWPDPIDTSDPDTKIDLFARNDQHFKYTYASCLRLTPEWREYTIFFMVPKEVSMFELKLNTNAGAEDIVPFDFDDVSLVRVESFDDSVIDGIATSYVEAEDAAEIMGARGSSWSAMNGATIDFEPKLTEYFHTDAPTTGVNTVITWDKNLDLVPGKYSLKAKYRLGEFNVNGNNTETLEVSVNSQNGSLYSTTVDITNIWTVFEKEFAVKDADTISDIEIRVNNKMVPLDFTDFEIDLISPYAEIEGWEGNSGAFELRYETYAPTGTDSYVSVSSLAEGSAGAVYRDRSVTFVPGVTYKFSVWMRTVSHTEIPDDFGGIIKDGKMNLNITVPKVVDENSGNLDLSNSAMVDAYAGGEMLTNNFQTTSAAQKCAVLGEEWQEYVVVFTPDKAGAIDITFRRFGNAVGEDIIPFEIDALSLVQVVSDGNGGYTEISGNLIKTGERYWSSAHGASVNFVQKTADAEYTVATAPESGNTEIYCTEAEMLTPGRYEITGSFRLPDFDLGEIEFTDDTQSTIASFGNNGNVILSMFSDDMQLNTPSGVPYHVTNTWTDATFVIETVTDIPMSSLKFVLDDSLDLAFKDISITQTDRHINLSDINGGIIMTLLMLKHDRDYNFKLMTTVDPVLDEETGLVGAEGGADTNEYIHVYNLNNPQSGVRYRDSSLKFVPGKTYVFSAWMRSAPMTNDGLTKADVVDDGVMNLDLVIPQVVTQNSGNLHLSNSAMLDVYANGKILDGTFYTGSGVQKSIILGTEWREYKVIFTASVGGNITLNFRRFAKGGEDVVPFDIDRVSLVEVLEDGQYGENLIKDDASLWTESGGGKFTFETESEFYRSIGGLRVSKDMVGYETEKLAPGKYAISADFRLANVDFSKITFAEDAATITANENKLAINATLYDEKLYTDKNRDYIYITNNWSRGTFILNVLEETPINEIRFTSGTKLELDFKALEIKYLGEAEIKDPNEEVIVRPDPLPAIREGNLIEGAMTSDNLPYWYSGDQKLTAKKASDGTTYLSASEIKNNSLGFTYEPGYTIMPGTYRFVGEFRTTNKGDSSIARVIVGGVSASTLIDNDWSKIDVVFAVTEETELTFKVRGGPISLNIQDYEMRNLQIIDANTITATSPFEDSDTTEYIHVSGLEGPGAGVRYLDTAVKLKPGSTYRFTAWLRSMPLIGADSSTGDVVNDGKMNLKVTIAGSVDENGGNLDLSNSAMIKSYANGKIVAGDFYLEGPEQKSMVLSTEWQPYSVIFTADKNGSVYLVFERFDKGGEDVVPFDIAGLSLIEIKDNGTFSTNIIKSDHSYWSEHDGAKMTFETVDEYETAKGSITLSSDLAGRTTISAGKYVVSATMRLSEVDASKITLSEDGHTVIENGNKASCTATLKGTALDGLKGEDAFEVTNDWNNVWFVFETSKSISVSDITLSLGEDVPFDIYNVKIEKNN